MRKKVLVTYSVKYIKEVKLEVTEEINNSLDNGRIITSSTKFHDYLIENNEDILLDLPIPDVTYSGDEAKYIDGSFEVESFEI